MCKKREKSEKEIEKAIQEHERGNLAFTQVQKKPSQSFDAKNTELTYHEYVHDLDKYNKMIEGSQFLYKDWLNKLQDLDMQRIKFIKASLNGFFSTYLDNGEIMKEKIIDSMSSAQLINIETDVKIFIDENRSKSGYFKKKEFVSYDYSKKIIKNREERIRGSGSFDDFLSFDSWKDAEIEITSKRSNSKYEGQDKTHPDAFDLLGMNDFEEIKNEEDETKTFNNNKEYVRLSIEGLFEGKSIAMKEQLKIFELLHENYITPIVKR
jgi:hypothetical protein